MQRFHGMGYLGQPCNNCIFGRVLYISSLTSAFDLFSLVIDMVVGIPVSSLVRSVMTNASRHVYDFTKLSGKNLHKTEG